MKSFTLSFLFTVLTITLAGQNYSLNDAQLSVSGTSSLHDWTCEVEKAKGHMEVSYNKEQLQDISDFTFSFEVRALKSGKKGMDKKMYKALREKDHPLITCQFNKLLDINKNWVQIEAFINIAGTQKPIILQGKIFPTDQGFSIKGSKAMKMSDFGVEPPKALMGTLTTGDCIKIHYEVYLQEQIPTAMSH